MIVMFSPQILIYQTFLIKIISPSFLEFFLSLLISLSVMHFFGGILLPNSLLQVHPMMSTTLCYCLLSSNNPGPVSLLI